ncbi:hypothetical protein Tco_0366273 [Tanacetum coccineum]
MNNPNITMEEYIRLEEERAQRRGETFNWQTTTFGKVRDYDEEECFTDFETEFPAIVLGNINVVPSQSSVILYCETTQGTTMGEYEAKKEDSETNFLAIVLDNTSTALSYKPTVSPLNESEIDFRILFDESDDEEYTAIFDENSFSYKIIFVDYLKTDSENDNNEDSLPSSPEPTISHSNDLDFFKEFENEFPAIAFIDNLKSELAEPSLSLPHIDELKIETSLSELDKEGQNPFSSNTAFSKDLKSVRDKDMASLPHRDLRHPWLRYQVEGYTEDIVHNCKRRLETIWDRSVNRVHIIYFEDLTPKMRQDLAMRLRMVYTGGDGQQIFVSNAWRRLFGIRAPLVHEFILEFLSTCRMSDTKMGLHTEQEMAQDGFGAYWSKSERIVPNKEDLRDYWIEILSDRDFLGAAPSYVHIRDPVRRLCHRTIACTISGRGQGPEKVTGVDLFYFRSMDRGTANVLYLLAQYLFKHVEGRKSGARLSRGHFIGRLDDHFGLISDEGLRGLSVISRELPVIDLHELAKLNICGRFGDTWAWVALGPERQPGVAADTPEAAEDALADDEGA